MLTQTLVDHIVTLLSRTENAHGQYEESELKGVYDQDWPQWYAAYILKHGLCELVPQEMTVAQVSNFLASSYEDFRKDSLCLGWKEYTARKLIELLSQES